MASNPDEIKQIAAQLLAAMLTNPHVYQTPSDEGANGQTERTLTIMAIEMAESLIEKVESRQVRKIGVSS
ncbi:MAG: hypothetical protein MJA27_04230 [Pseudanabaenales cyanobacterium]|nr:hypothetical protein [Pseudanabaenales cyanobacterium]